MQYKIGYLGGQWIKCRSFGIRFAAASGHTNFGYTHKHTNNWRIELNSQFCAILISSIHLCSDGYREVFSCVLELLVMEFHLPRYRKKNDSDSSSVCEELNIKWKSNNWTSDLFYEFSVFFLALSRHWFMSGNLLWTEVTGRQQLNADAFGNCENP